MALVDELSGLFGPEAVAKLTPELRSKLELGEQLTSYYNNETDEIPVRQPARSAQTPAAAVTPPAATSLVVDMAAIEGLFDKKLGNISETIKSQVDEVVKERGDKLFNDVLAVSMRNTRELIQVENRYREDFKEPLDENKLNEFINEQGKKGTRYATVTDAYNAFTADKYVAKRVEDGVRDGLKNAQSGQHLPGVTPTASRGPVAILQSRRANDGGAGGETAVSRAGKALAERMAASGNQV